MSRNIRTQRRTTIGVEALDGRISLSGFSLGASTVVTYVPTPHATFRLPPTPMPPTTPGTFINITGMHLYGLSK